MSVTPGSVTKLNPVIGLSTTLTLTPTDIGDTVKMSKVLPKGVLVSFPNGNIALTDGITALNALTPIVDQVLTETEKLALMHTFSGTDETYKAVEGGFLVLGANGEMASANLPSSIWNEGTGKLLVSALPDSVRAGISVVSDYAALLAATDEQKRGLILVADASGDSTVDNGAALYQWLTDKSSFLKISEVESLDIDIDALRPNYANVQAAGAVMYDHTLMLEPPSLTDMVALMEASLNNPGQPLETASYMEMLGSGGNFIFRIENESQLVAYWNTNGGANATFINAGKPAFKLILGPSADGMHYFYAPGTGAKTGDAITWEEVTTEGVATSGGATSIVLTEDRILSATDSRTLVFSSEIDDLKIALPAGNTLSQVGESFRIANVGTNNIQITDSSKRIVGSGMGILLPNTIRECVLLDKDTDKWVIYDAGTAIVSGGNNDSDYSLVAHQATIFKSASTGGGALGTTNRLTTVPLSSTKILLIFRDNSNTYRGTAVVLTSNGETCTLGTPIVLKASAASNFSATKLSNDKVLVAFCDEGNSNSGTVILLSVVNDTISVAATKVFVSAAWDISIVALTSSTAVVMYRNGNTPTCGEVQLLTIAGTTITSASTLKFGGTPTSVHSLVRISDTQALAVYCDENSGFLGKACCLTVNGSTLTVGAAKIFSNKTTRWIDITQLTKNKYLVVFQVYEALNDKSKDYRGNAVIISVSDLLDMTIGKSSIVAGEDSTGYTVCALSSSSAMISFWNIAENTCVAKMLKIDGFSISAGDEYTLYPFRSNHIVLRAIDSKTALLAYTDGNNGGYGIMQLISRI